MLGGTHAFIWLGLSTALGLTATVKVNITSAEDLANFSLRSRSTSENHAMLCVLSDLDFSNTSYTPIQNFHGTFDGQGYLIKNFHPNSTRIGSLFGHSKGMTIRNVIMDYSCGIENDKGQPWVGGIIGSCSGSDLPCIIENNVNMGNITYSLGNAYLESVMIGGIIGRCLGGKPYECRISNCANHGSVNIILRNCENFVTFAGGIVGFIESVAKGAGHSFIYNSINYGEINYLGSNESLSHRLIGGIVGSIKNNIILENCVSMGNLSENASSISGYVDGHPDIRNCFWHASLGSPFREIQSNITVFNTLAFDNNFLLGKTNKKRVTSVLNRFTDARLTEKSGWLLNKNRNKGSFYVNNRKRVTLENPIILTPSLAGGRFSGWYKNKRLDAPIVLTEEVSEKESFYSRFHESFFEEPYHTTTAGAVTGYVFFVILFLMVIGLVVFLIIHMFRQSGHATYTSVQ